MKTLVTFIFMSLISSILFSQKKETHADKMEKRVEILDKQLDLSDKQEDDLQLILLKYHKQREEYRRQMENDRKMRMKQIMDAQNRELANILTPEQLEKYKGLEKRMEEKGKQNKEKQYNKDQDDDDINDDLEDDNDDDDKIDSKGQKENKGKGKGKQNQE